MVAVLYKTGEAQSSERTAYSLGSLSARLRRKNESNPIPIMDQLQRAFFGLHFRADFLSKRGEAFQDWFVRIMQSRYLADFDAVRAYGAKGDFKCDGRRLSTGTIYQCYAPYDLKESETIAKIKEDFAGALAHWPEFMRSWCFVHNDDRGLPPNVEKLFDEMRREHPGIAVTVMNEAELRDIVFEIEVEHLEALFCAVPTMTQLNAVSLEDIKPLLDELARVDPDPLAENIAPPSPRKLEKNGLSDEAASMLRLGRQRQQKVAEYFDKTAWPDVGERIAEAFRKRYADLKAMPFANAEWTFGQLAAFAGMAGEPKRQAAALSILAYFFERCDIFEDPDDDGQREAA